MSFDRLLYIDRLKDAGVGEAVARAHAEALREALSDTVATKTDLKEATSTLGSEISIVRSEISTLRSDVKADMAELRSEFKSKISALDRKIEITARDLTIRGASGLMIIASLIIGLKLFG